MAHNPRIINRPNDIVEISGSVEVEGQNNYLSASQIESLNYQISSLSLSGNIQSNTTSVASTKKQVAKISTSSVLSASQVILANASGGELEITVPNPDELSYNEYVIKKTDISSNKVIVKGKHLGHGFEEAILSGSFAINASDYFAYSVATNALGDKIIIGAIKDETTGAGGIAYIFSSGSSGWQQETILTGTFINSSDDFGHCVAMNAAGDRVAIGAPSAASGSVLGGLAYLFVSGSTGWYQKSILYRNPVLGGGFGNAIAMNDDGTIVAVGCKTAKSSTATSAPAHGSVYMYNLGYTSAANVTQTQILIASGSGREDGDAFGDSVALDSTGYTVFIGATYDEYSTAWPDGGYVYVFEGNGSTWSERHRINDFVGVSSIKGVGRSVAVSKDGNKLFTGAPETPTNGTISSNGRVYVYRKTGSSYYLETTLQQPVDYRDSSDNFGISVSTNQVGDKVIVGAYRDEPISSGSNFNNGLAFLYTSASSGWTLSSVFSGSFATNSGDYFGYSVAMNSLGNKMFVGAYTDETGSTSSTGLAYVFEEAGTIDGRYYKILDSQNNSFKLMGNNSFSWSVI